MAKSTLGPRIFAEAQQDGLDRIFVGSGTTFYAGIAKDTTHAALIAAMRRDGVEIGNEGIQEGFLSSRRGDVFSVEPVPSPDGSPRSIIRPETIAHIGELAGPSYSIIGERPPTPIGERRPTPAGMRR